MTARAWMWPGLIGLIAVVSVSALFLGSTPMAPGRVFAALIGAGETGDTTIIWRIRAPRLLAALITGGALGLAGAALQGLLRNPLAEPGVLGVSAAATLTAASALYFGLVAVHPLILPLAAALGAMAATGLLALIAARLGSPVALILVGVGLSSFAGALMALLMNFAPNPFTLADLVNWTLGSVANRSFEDIALAAPFLAAGGVTILVARGGLTALTLGEEAAGAVGVNLQRVRAMTVAGAGLVTGGAVALAGAVGFVGVVAPHLVRPLVGYDPARTLAPAAALGAALVAGADVCIRLAPTASELKLGVAAALIGAPVFVWIAARSRGFGARGHGDG